MALLRSVRGRRLSITAVGAALLAVAACASPVGSGSTSGAACEASARPLTIATGSATGVYAALGSALASQISSSTPLKATAVQTGSTLRNVQQLSTGEYDIAFAQADSAADAVLGQGVFAEPQKIRALARIYSDYTHVIVSAASGITSMADFRGKKISVGSASSGTELIANRLLTAAGLDPKKDVSSQNLDLAASAAAIKAGSIDGFVWSGGLPTGGIADLFASDGASLKFVDISGLIPAMQKDDDVYAAGTIPAATYKTAGDIKTIALPNLLLVRDDFPAADACAVTKVLFQQKNALVAAVPAASGLDPKAAADTAPVQLNDGSRAAITQLGNG
ncbi:TAXI family TRAP transporter solute-binding subunit [Pseudonocardia sp. GCM10023141]|uniref:TAXI family TRAP transporter solute-binding subunit n=1 Tax=Pseudonocardia sp. GCM10023141 TaxID=3252653 RepID=UPI0036078020